MAEKVGAIYCRMCDIMADIQAIGKNKENRQQGFMYRGIDDIYAAIHPILVKHRVFMRASVVNEKREERLSSRGTVLAFVRLHMAYYFVADDGSMVATEAYGEGMDAGDKASNKAMAIAHKYALIQAFCIPVEGMDDPDAESHELVEGEADDRNETGSTEPDVFIAQMLEQAAMEDGLEGLEKAWKQYQPTIRRLAPNVREAISRLKDDLKTDLTGDGGDDLQ